VATAAGQRAGLPRRRSLCQAGAVRNAGKTGVKYAIGLPVNHNLERSIRELLKRPVGRPCYRPVVRYKSSWRKKCSPSPAEKGSFPGVASPPDAKPALYHPGAAADTADQNRAKPCRVRLFGLYSGLESESQNGNPC